MKYVEKIGNILDLIRTEHFSICDLKVINASPACGILYVTTNSPYFVSGQVRLRGKDNGRYPFNYLEMIDNLFGKADNTIEVCSGGIRSNNCFTVDINPKADPALVDDGQELSKLLMPVSIVGDVIHHTMSILQKKCIGPVCQIQENY